MSRLLRWERAIPVARASFDAGKGAPLKWCASGRRLFLAAPAIALAGGARAQGNKLAIPAKWYAVRVEDDAFTVEMPGIPDHRVINDVSARGTPFALHSYSLESGGFSYVVQTALYPAEVDVVQPRRVLQAALDARGQQLASRKWDSTDWRDVGGGAQVESIGTVRPGAMLRLLSLLKERRYVSLAFLGPAVNGPEANRFFQSLKLKA